MLLDSNRMTYGRYWPFGLEAKDAESALRQQDMCSLSKAERHRAAVAEELCRSREQAWLSDTTLQEAEHGLELDRKSSPGLESMIASFVWTTCVRHT